MVLVAGCLLQSLSQQKVRGAGKTQESQAEVWTLPFVWGKMLAAVTDMMKPSRQTETQVTAPCALKTLENLELG